ncbi:MAG: D-sedoheptulose 7-phosphate isomerase [Candidatus Omnitrophota bacterium]
MKKKIERSLKESIEVKKLVIEKEIDSIKRLASLMIDVVRSGNKIIVFGNGGSASDSLHMAAELVGRFKKERKAIPAVALTSNTSILTCIGNDYSFDKVFERQIEALGKKGDIALGISTSGRSKNVISALKKAKEMGLKTSCLIGEYKKDIENFSDAIISVPSKDTPRIQESHGTIIHILCELIEDAL